MEIAFLFIYNIVSQTITNYDITKALNDIINVEINARLRMIEGVDKLSVELEEARIVIHRLRLELGECYSSRKGFVSNPITST